MTQEEPRILPEHIDVYLLEDGRMDFGQKPPLGLCVETAHYTRAPAIADSGWQPIETAPRNTRCLTWCKLDGGRVEISEKCAGTWWNDSYPEYHPTHWQPLLSPPQAATDEG